MKREKLVVARCTAERLMRQMGLLGVIRGKARRTTFAVPKAACPLNLVKGEFRPDWPNRLAEAGIEPSVGSKGDSYDNALAETINRLCKAEVIHLRSVWKTIESVELATLE